MSVRHRKEKEATMPGRAQGHGPPIGTKDETDGHREDRIRRGLPVRPRPPVIHWAKDSYSLTWTQDLTHQPGSRLGLAALSVVAEALWSITTPLFFVILGLWALDFVAGVVATVRDPGDELRWERAGDSAVKLLLYVILSLASTLAGVAMYEILQQDFTGYFLTGSYSFVVVMEVRSIARNLARASPAMRGVLQPVLDKLPGANELPEPAAPAAATEPPERPTASSDNGDRPQAPEQADSGPRL